MFKSPYKKQFRLHKEKWYPNCYECGKKILNAFRWNTKTLIIFDVPNDKRYLWFCDEICKKAYMYKKRINK